MKILFVAIASLAITISAYTQSSTAQFEALLNKCEGFNSSKYTCWPYVQAAVYLQTFDKTKATDILKEYAKTSNYEDQIIVLTKMMFQPQPNSTLRRPMIGGASFLGGTDYADWTNEPIQLVNKVPFLITTGYSLGGQAEPAIDYLNYCIENGIWSVNNYKIRQDDLKSALNLLIDGTKWSTTLSANEKAFLEAQIK